MLYSYRLLIMPMWAILDLGLAPHVEQTLLATRESATVPRARPPWPFVRAVGAMLLSWLRDTRGQRWRGGTVTRPQVLVRPLLSDIDRRCACLARFTPRAADDVTAVFCSCASHGEFDDIYSLHDDDDGLPEASWGLCERDWQSCSFIFRTFPKSKLHPAPGSRGVRWSKSGPEG